MSMRLISTITQASISAMKRVTSAGLLSPSSLQRFCIRLSRHVIEAVLDRLPGQVVEPRSPFLPSPVTVGENVAKSQRAMVAGSLIRNLVLVKQLHECRPTDTEQVGGLLSRQPLLERCDRDRLSCLQSFDSCTKTSYVSWQLLDQRRPTFVKRVSEQCVPQGMSFTVDVFDACRLSTTAGPCV